MLVEDIPEIGSSRTIFAMETSERGKFIGMILNVFFECMIKTHINCMFIQIHIHNAWSKRISFVWHLDTYERIWNFPWLELFIVPNRIRSYLMSFLAKKASLILLFTSKYFTVSRSGKFWRVRTKIANLLSNTVGIFCTIF